MEPPKKFRTKRLVSFDAVPSGAAGTIFKISVCFVLFAWFFLIRTFPARGRVSFEPIQPVLDVLGAVYVAALFYIIHYATLKFAKSKLIKTTWFALEGLIVVLAFVALIQKQMNRSNQSSEPTPASVTPPAGQESRPR
jgi:hypothetical protein